MTLPAHLDHGGRRVVVKYHEFDSGMRRHPPNSRSGLEAALARGVAAIEFDVGLMRDGGFALLDDATLDLETTGSGRLRAIDTVRLQALRLRGWDEAPATLAQVTERQARGGRRLPRPPGPRCRGVLPAQVLSSLERSPTA